MTQPRNSVGISLLLLPAVIAFTVVGASRISAQQQAEEKVEATKEAKPVKKGDAKTDAAKTAEKTVAKKAEKAKVPVNPLQNLFKGVFGPKPNRADAPEVKPLNGDKMARDHIDARAPHVPEHASLIRTVKSQISERRYEDALIRIQHILELKEDSLVRTKANKFVSIRAEANRLLAQLPDQYMNSYRLVNGPVAKRLLSDAHLSGDQNLLIAVATRYFHTEAGQQATNELGSHYFDVGQFGMATRWFTELIDTNADVTQQPMWKVKAALAFRQTGDTEKAAELLADLPHNLLENHGIKKRPDEWANGLAAPKATALTKVEDWRMPFGTANRMGIGSGGDPLLLPRWSHPISAKPAVIEKIQTLLEDLEDQQRAPIPSIFPITVGGHVVVRTFDGMHVLNAATGKMLWQSSTDNDVSPDMLLTGSAPNTMQMQQVFGGPFAVRRVSSGSSNTSALMGLLFRNGLYGSLTSDGKRLFVIQSQALMSSQQPGYSYSDDPSVNDPFRRDWNTNKIVAYSLKDGHIEWEIGDTETGEPFDRPLAGWYLFGPPSPDGDKLYVVGEKDSEVRLFELDPLSGRPNWSQLIAFSDAKISKDFGRRWWASQVSSDKGVLVCPTTMGWLVAVEQGSRSVLWAHRYSKIQSTKNRYGRSMSLVQNTSLNDRWCMSAPIIVGNRVIFAPPEEQTLECLHLFSGERLWTTSKGDSLYVAGVFDDQVVIVSATAVKALSLKDGTTKWTTPIEPEAGRPSGHGVAADGVYHLPLMSGQLWTLNVNNGKVQKKSYLPAEMHQLGNLVMYQGMLLSMNPYGLTSFEQKDFIENEIARRKELSPNDAWALMREAQIALQKRDYKTAWASLSNANTDNIDADLKEKHRLVSRSTLTSIIRRSDDAPERAKLLDELKQYVRSKDEQVDFDRLVADLALASGDHDAAFKVYWRLFQEVPLDRMVIGDDEDAQVQMGLWLSGRVAKLWESASDELKKSWDTLIEQHADAVIASKDARKMTMFIRGTSFHPASIRTRWKLIDQFIASKNFAKAELHLLRQSLVSDASVAAAAHLKLAEYMAKQGLVQDAAKQLDVLAAQLGTAKLANGELAKVAADRVRKSLKPPKTDSIGWPAKNIKMVQSVTYSSSRQVKELMGEIRNSPFTDRFRIVHDGSTQQIRFVDAHNDQMHWVQALRDGRKGSSTVTAQTVGHTFYVLYRDALHCLSPVDQAAVWPAKVLNSRGQQVSPYYQSGYSYGSRFQMYKGTDRLTRYWGLNRQYNQNGMLAAATETCLCVYDRRAVKVYDPATGELLWTRKGRSQNSKIYASSDYVILRDGSENVAYRASDGQQVDLKEVSDWISKGLRINGNDIVTTTATTSGSTSTLARIFGGGVTTRKFVVQSVNMTTKKPTWKAEYGNGSYVTRVDEDTLVVLQPATKDEPAKISTLDLLTGQQQQLSSTAQEGGKDVQQVTEDPAKLTPFAIADRDNIYVYFYKRKSQNSYWGVSLRTMRVNGTFHAFSRRTGEHLWKQTVNDQQLVLEQFRHMPIMAFVVRRSEKIGNQTHYLTNLLAIDKRTGAELTKLKSPRSSYIQSVQINMTDQYVDLQSYNERFRFMAMDQVAAAGGAKPVDKPDSSDGKPTESGGSSESESAPTSQEDATEEADTAEEAPAGVQKTEAAIVQ